MRRFARVFGVVAISLCACGGAEAKFKLLYSFSRGLDGAWPAAGLLRDNLGNLYGTANLGGTYDRGTVFKLAADGTFTTLHAFAGGSDGAYPEGGLIADSDGNLFGTTPEGGHGDMGHGTVYKLAPDGTETLLLAFGKAKGLDPTAELIADAQGNLFGTTYQGGHGLSGVVFELEPSGRELLLHTFHGFDGAHPQAGLIADASGNLYGTTAAGGHEGDGAVFRLAPNGKEKVLYSFADEGDGYSPVANLIMDVAGNLYGTTGGDRISGDYGNVFRVTPDATETVLYAFKGGSDGYLPRAGVIADKTGNLYGTTDGGGAYGSGTVFKIAPDGTETVLHSFSGHKGDGANPYGGVVMDEQGNLYGTTIGGGAHDQGTIFELTP